MWGLKDKGSWGSTDVGIQGHWTAGIWGQRDLGPSRCRDNGIWGHEDAGTWGHRDLVTPRPRGRTGGCPVHLLCRSGTSGAQHNRDGASSGKPQPAGPASPGSHPRQGPAPSVGSPGSYPRQGSKGPHAPPIAGSPPAPGSAAIPLLQRAGAAASSGPKRSRDTESVSRVLLPGMEQGWGPAGGGHGGGAVALPGSPRLLPKSGRSRGGPASLGALGRPRGGQDRGVLVSPPTRRGSGRAEPQPGPAVGCPHPPPPT